MADRSSERKPAWTPRRTPRPTRKIEPTERPFAWARRRGFPCRCRVSRARPTASSVRFFFFSSNHSSPGTSGDADSVPLSSRQPPQGTRRRQRQAQGRGADGGHQDGSRGRGASHSAREGRHPGRALLVCDTHTRTHARGAYNGQVCGFASPVIPSWSLRDSVARFDE